jgi:hypothetical protein
MYFLFISRTGCNGTSQHVSLVSCFFHLSASVAEVVLIEVDVFNLGELFWSRRSSYLLGKLTIVLLLVRSYLPPGSGTDVLLESQAVFSTVKFNRLYKPKVLGSSPPASLLAFLSSNSFVAVLLTRLLLTEPHSESGYSWLVYHKTCADICLSQRLVQ